MHVFRFWLALEAAWKTNNEKNEEKTKNEKKTNDKKMTNDTLSSNVVFEVLLKKLVEFLVVGRMRLDLPAEKRIHNSERFFLLGVQ